MRKIDSHESEQDGNTLGPSLSCAHDGPSHRYTEMAAIILAFVTNTYTHRNSVTTTIEFIFCVLDVLLLLSSSYGDVTLFFCYFVA